MQTVRCRVRDKLPLLVFRVTTLPKKWVIPSEPYKRSAGLRRRRLKLRVLEAVNANGFVFMKLCRRYKDPMESVTAGQCYLGNRHDETRDCRDGSSVADE